MKRIVYTIYVLIKYLIQRSYFSKLLLDRLKFTSLSRLSIFALALFYTSRDARVAGHIQ